MGSVEADDERRIAVADDWQLQRLAGSSSTCTAAFCPGDIGGPSLRDVAARVVKIKPSRSQMF